MISTLIVVSIDVFLLEPYSTSRQIASGVGRRVEAQMSSSFVDLGGVGAFITPVGGDRGRGNVDGVDGGCARAGSDR